MKVLRERDGDREPYVGRVFSADGDFMVMRRAILALSVLRPEYLRPYNPL